MTLTLKGLGLSGDGLCRQCFPRLWLWIEARQRIGQRLSTGEYLILATSEPMESAFEIYSRRWEIETLFGCLKTRGFNFESTHLTDPERLSKLFELVAIAACWAHKAGELKATRKPIKIEKHERKAKSIFRYGLDHIRSILNNIFIQHAEFISILKLLSST